MNITWLFVFLTLMNYPLAGQAQEDGSCKVGEDGSCLPVDDLPRLPPPAPDGKYHVGFGEPQKVDHSNEQATILTLRLMLEYMHQVFQDETYTAVRDQCRNKHSECTQWAARGEWYVHQTNESTLSSPLNQTDIFGYS